MNPLQRSLIEKTGHDFGFEYVSASDSASVTLASARHPAHVQIFLEGDGYRVIVVQGSELLRSELARDFVAGVDGFNCPGLEPLAGLLARAASLGRALPNTAQLEFEQRVSDELALLPDTARGTEVERMVRQRVGQDAFRQAMLDYWGGSCAATELTTREVLRASHAKSWAACSSDTERLDVFNGFLLCANLDALFDRGLVTFDDQGGLLVCGRINDEERTRLGLNCQLSLRWLAEEHMSYLAWHRDNLFDRQ